MVNVTERDNSDRIINHCATDFEGNFSMVVKSTANELEITYIGYKTQKIEIGDRTVFDVKMVKNQAWVGRDSSNDKADWRNLTYEPKMFSDTAWAHFVITREWTPTVDSAPFGAGTITGSSE